MCKDSLGRNSRWLAAIFLCVIGGCTTSRTTDPVRTATEQFLLSVATSEAIAQLAADEMRGRSAFVDASYVLKVVDSEFIVAETRAHLLQNGVRLVSRPQDAEIIVELRSGGSGVDRDEFLVGIPSLPIGVAVNAAGGPATPITTPELALLKRVRQYGFTGIALVAYWRDTGEVVASTGPFVGRSRREDWWIIGFGPNGPSNVPTTEPYED